MFLEKEGVTPKLDFRALGPRLPVFFNLFGEVESFAAILIAHRTHVFFGGEGTPEARKAEIRGQRPRTGERFLGRGSEPPSHQLEVCRSTVIYPSGVQGGALSANTFWTY